MVQVLIINISKIPITSILYFYKSIFENIFLYINILMTEKLLVQILNVVGTSTLQKKSSNYLIILQLRKKVGSRGAIKSVANSICCLKYSSAKIHAH